jgi:hypothetical protein
MGDLEVRETSMRGYTSLQVIQLDQYCQLASFRVFTETEVTEMLWGVTPFPLGAVLPVETVIRI